MKPARNLTTEQSLSSHGVTNGLTETISLLISLSIPQRKGPQDDILTGIHSVAQDALHRALSGMRAADLIDAVSTILLSGEPRVCM